MTGKQNVINIEELLSSSVKERIDKYKIVYFESFERKQNVDYLLPFYTDLYIYLLVKSGRANITINYNTHQVGENNIIVLSPLHIIQFTRIDKDFCCSFLMVNKSFIDIPSMEKVFKHLNRSVKLFNNPVMNLCQYEYSVLLKCLNNIQDKIEQTSHFMQKEIIQNSFVAFLLEWINIYETHTLQNLSRTNLNRFEQILNTFISLLKEHFKERHYVSFYAEKLNITPQYLTLIVKKTTGQTINEFIFDMLYSEARILLNRTDLSVQQISDELYFSDASAFCKFFKRYSGTTPMKYRNK